ncbi:uncharacterized protein LOC62_02G002496 [Vanrija pseudolonga]|uniref:Uncharacterized protein n=1 Tax=Vanrija pseudolonga TaxID=143232 RepID=A0AAF1BP69_9TREE|nr:hypothetical protein LOC62_02G002496 [Vanrija pseudolonga]
MILDGLCAYADHATLLSLRATSKAMCKRVDEYQQHHIVVRAEPFPDNLWTMVHDGSVMQLFTPNIVVWAYTSPDPRLHRIPALRNWHEGIFERAQPGATFSIGPLQVLSPWAPINDGKLAHKPRPLPLARVVDLMGHVPVERITELVWAAPGLETTRYFPGGQGVSMVGTCTTHVVINTYLVSPDGDARSPQFNYMAPVIGGTRRVVINIAYRVPCAWSKGKVEIARSLPQSVDEVVLVFNRIPEGHWKAFERNVEIKPEPKVTQKTAPKTAGGVLSEAIVAMALYFKSAHFKKLPFAIKFKFVGADRLDRSVFGLEDGDDLLTEVVEGVEAALRDKEAPPHRLVNPRRELTESEIATFREMAYDHIAFLTHAEYKASSDPVRFALEAESTMHLYD